MAKSHRRVEIPPQHLVQSTIDRLTIELKMARQLLRLSKLAEHRRLQASERHQIDQKEPNNATSR